MFIGIMLRTSPVADGMVYWQAITVSMTICFICAYIAVLIAYSSIFDSVNTKQRRIAFLMLPATNLERWLTALIYAIVVWPICIGLAFLVGDLLRTVFFGLIGYGWVNWIKFLFDYISNSWPSWYSIIDHSTDVASLLWIASVYVLGGTLFRKRAFVIVSLILIALMIAFAVAAEHLMPQEGNINISFGNRLIDKSIIALIFIAFSVFNFWLSYRIFRRFQVITSKWTNL